MTSVRTMPDPCPGSLGAPGERPRLMTFLPTARCAGCGRFVEIHPIIPGGLDVWRLEMHDATGCTLTPTSDGNPRADSVMPDECVQCRELYNLRLAPDGE